MQLESGRPSMSLAVLSGLALAYQQMFTRTHMHIQSQSADTQTERAVYVCWLCLVYSWITTHKQWRLCPEMGLWVSALWCGARTALPLESGLTFPCFYPICPITLFLPVTQAARGPSPTSPEKGLPLHHHSRKSTVTEYPEAPGGWLNAWPVWLKATLLDLTALAHRRWNFFLPLW